MSPLFAVGGGGDIVKEIPMFKYIKRLTQSFFYSRKMSKTQKYAKFKNVSIFV